MGPKPLSPRISIGAALAAGTLLACSHPDPFSSGGYAPSQPFSTAIPRRLTFSSGTDLTPAWLPDGSAFLYSFVREDRADLDRCLGQLPADGGARTLTICNTAAGTDDSVDAYLNPAGGPGGALAYVVSSSPVGFLSPSRMALVIATLSSPSSMVSVRSFPYLGPTGHPHDAPSHVGWLSANELVYLANRVEYVGPCQGCPPDTVSTGQEIVRLQLGGASPTLQVVPGTDYASSVDPGADGTSIFFTLGGDTRVFREDLGSGTATVTHDFGAAGIARDVRVAGNVLVAVVGGKVSFAIDPFTGPTQKDAGGLLYTVDLQTGGETLLPLPGLFVRHPALAPDGKRIVAEAYDTAGSKLSDLWLLESP